MAINVFLAKSVLSQFSAIAWRKIGPKIVPVEKNDKYEVWPGVYTGFYTFAEGLAQGNRVSSGPFK